MFTKKLSIFRRKKRSFTLLEIMIGLLLSTLLIGSLFEVQRQFYLLQAKVEGARQTVFERERFYSKLAQIFHHATNCWIEKESLVLKYSQFLDHDRNFRGECLSLLHTDNDTLILTTYGQGSHVKQEVLLKLAKHAHISFLIFDPQTSQWVDQIPKTLFQQEAAPRSLIKICVTNPQKNTIEFPFWIHP